MVKTLSLDSSIALFRKGLEYSSLGEDFTELGARDQCCASLRLA